MYCISSVQSTIRGEIKLNILLIFLKIKIKILKITKYDNYIITKIKFYIKQACDVTPASACLVNHNVGASLIHLRGCPTKTRPDK